MRMANAQTTLLTFTPAALALYRTFTTELKMPTRCSITSVL